MCDWVLAQLTIVWKPKINNYLRLNPTKAENNIGGYDDQHQWFFYPWWPEDSDYKLDEKIIC